MRQLYLALATLLILSSCSKTDVTAPVTNLPVEEDFYSKNAKSSSQVAIDWMNAYRAIVKSEGKNPPHASRIYAYGAIGLYEAVVPGMGGYKSLEDQISGLINIPKVKKGQLDHITSANEAMYQVALKIFGTLQPANLALIESLHNNYVNDAVSRLKPKSYNESVDFGKAVAIAVLARADNDNFAATRSLTYTVPSTSVNPMYWSPTGPVTSPVEPYWGTLKCFAMPNGAACTIKSSIPFSTDHNSAFYKQANEVVLATNNLTQEQKNIALWWADGGGTPTPPGHWIGIATGLASEKNLDLGKAAEMFAKLNIVMADAFISCWNEKYRFNLLRPVSYIRTYIPGQSNWTSYIATPPFPEYPSGHSVASGAASEILTKVFGKKTRFTDNANVSMGLSPRTFGSFEEAANEAAMSRLYGGIHYREAIEKGISQGKEVSVALNKNLKFK